MAEIKHIICYSGGHSSAIVAVETVRRFGKDNVILLNHDINPRYENSDIKRFKKEVADYLGIEITYANMNGITDPNLIPSQFEVCEDQFDLKKTEDQKCPTCGSRDLRPG